MIKTIKFLPLLSIFTLLSCVPKEMISIDPDFNFKKYQSKNILFVGFDIKDKKVKIPETFKTSVENSIYKNFDNINNIKIKRYNDSDKVTPENLKTILEKNNSSLIIMGNLDSFLETKYIDNPVTPLYSDANVLYRNDSNNLRTLIRYQVSVVGSLSFFDLDGKKIWTQNIDDFQNVQFEETSQTSVLDYNKNDSKVYSVIKERLIDEVTQKVMKNLVPYYVYK